MVLMVVEASIILIPSTDTIDRLGTSRLIPLLVHVRKRAAVPVVSSIHCHLEVTGAPVLVVVRVV